jgi:hypothetical protein
MSDMPFDQLCELLCYNPKGRPLSSAEVAELLSVHPITVDQWRVRGDGVVSRSWWKFEGGVISG